MKKTALIACVLLFFAVLATSCASAHRCDAYRGSISEVVE